jgi:hypothetical protein
MVPKQIGLTVLLLVEVSKKLAMEYIKTKDEKPLGKKKKKKPEHELGQNS